MQKAACVLLCLVAFEVADVDADDADDADDVICSFSNLSPPQPTTADLQQVDRRYSLNRRQGAQAQWQTKAVIYPLSKQSGIVLEDLTQI